MSIKIEGRQCVVCKAYLFEDDDVVFCAECGAPHHRDCYHSLGKCGLSDLHGTADEYNYEATKENAEQQDNKAENGTTHCRRCGKPLEADAQFCSYCGIPNAEHPQIASALRNFTMNPKKELEKGVTLEQAAKVVAVNTTRYIPKFEKLNRQKKLSWNWAAFLLPHGWFAFRKMYGASALVSVLMIVSTLFTIPLLIAMGRAPDTDVKTTLEAIELARSIFMETGIIPIMFTIFSNVINLAVRIISALFGDWLYRDRVINSVLEINKSEDKEAVSRKLCGVSTLGFSIAVFAVYFLPNLLAMFI